MSEYRNEKFRLGREYQDFIMDLLHEQLGLSLMIYSSEKRQMTEESRNGVEVKYDMKHKKTGNLYIELAEKADPRRGDFALSGICNRNNWLYVIGDYEEVYGFGMRILWKLPLYIEPTIRNLVSVEDEERLPKDSMLPDSYEVFEIDRGTSIGFLWPKKQAALKATFVLRKIKGQWVRR